MPGRRATITVGRTETIKTYHQPELAAHEIAWYQAVPWACPRLIDADPDHGRLVIATHSTAPGYRAVDGLARLLRSLEGLSIHHRDVHPGNIVAGPDGPLLIDWETAILADVPSYDLHGPEVSGVPVPDIHTAVPGYVMWWGSPHRHSIRERWGADVPARMA